MKELEAKVDLESGQELFKPRTGRAPAYERNRSKLPIGEYLYGLRYEFDDKKEFMMEKEVRHAPPARPRRAVSIPTRARLAGY